MQPTENKQPLCSVCKIKYKKELETTRRYKTIDDDIVCDECYNELFRLSKSKKLSIIQTYSKFTTTIRKLRHTENRTKSCDRQSYLDNILLFFCDKKCESKTYIYFIICNTSKYEKYNTVKIGFSDNPKERLKTLQTGNPHELKLWYYFPVNKNDGKYLEDQLHRKFRFSKSRGEWFKLHKAIRNWVKEHKKYRDIIVK